MHSSSVTVIWYLKLRVLRESSAAPPTFVIVSSKQCFASFLRSLHHCNHHSPHYRHHPHKCHPHKCFLISLLVSLLLLTEILLLLFILICISSSSSLSSSSSPLSLRASIFPVHAVCFRETGPRILAHPNANAEWWTTGRGMMRKISHSEPESKPLNQQMKQGREASA